MGIMSREGERMLAASHDNAILSCGMIDRNHIKRQLRNFQNRLRSLHFALRRGPTGEKTPPALLIASAGGVIALALLAYGLALFAPPKDFPIYREVQIPTGLTLLESTLLLEEEGVVRSSLLLWIVLMSAFRDEQVQAGTYYFPKKLPPFAAARAVVFGEHGVPPVVLTIHEGLRVEQIAHIAHRLVKSIDPEKFIELARDKEGYLFPDTYYIPENFTAAELVALMEETFRERIVVLEEALEASPYSREDIITMASILEREARNDESMYLVAGILWRRLEMDMPLQVDAVFEYILGKSSAELTLDDLQTDSPYNTYTNLGLPPTPIANPGLFAIEAALNPSDSPYLFYLTGLDGNFYYAETFEEHRQNKELYL